MQSNIIIGLIVALGFALGGMYLQDIHIERLDIEVSSLNAKNVVLTKNLQVSELESTLVDIVNKEVIHEEVNTTTGSHVIKF